jgi:cob(I)alamin adenosyltransferase
LKFIPGITLRQYGRECFIEKEPVKEDIEAGRRGLSEVSAYIAKNQYDVVIFDEVCIALYYHLFTVDELLEIIQSRPETMEILMTGRYAPQELVDAADLVTEMNEIKHYYQKGINAREGIDY